MKGRRDEHTRFFFSPVEIGLPGDKPASFLAVVDAEEAGETPAKGHAQLVGAGEASLVAPLEVSLGVQLEAVLGTRCQKGVDETVNPCAGDVQGGVGEKERGGET